MSKVLRIASRGSLLARTQALQVSRALEERGFAIEWVYLKTTGDKVQDRYLHEIGGKGLFIKELEDALLTHKADLAVHSMKDLPARLDSRFTIAATLTRADVRDVLLLGKNIAPLPMVVRAADLGTLRGKKIGTASLRRQSLLATIPDVRLLGLRGNVDTRLAKLDAGEFDAIVLAAAALERLNICDRTMAYLEPRWFVPAPAQGVLCVETLADSPILEQLRFLDHAPTRLCATLEREVLQILGGDCTLPFGCYSNLENDVLTCTALLLAPGKAAQATCTIPWRQLNNPGRSELFAQSVCSELKQKGGDDILLALGKS